MESKGIAGSAPKDAEFRAYRNQAYAGEQMWMHFPLKTIFFAFSGRTAEDFSLAARRFIGVKVKRLLGFWKNAGSPKLGFCDEGEEEMDLGHG